MELNIEKLEKLEKNIKYYKITNSTHKIAKEIIQKENTKLPNLIIADEQDAGMGTHDRAWYTGKEKNLAFSLIYYPNCKINNLDNITINIAKYIKIAIKKLYNYELTIKNPNDLLLNGKKICGILTEIKTIKDDVKSLIISIGFNINEENFPDELKEIATSLKIVYKKEFPREKILYSIIKEIDQMVSSILRIK